MGKLVFLGRVSGDTRGNFYTQTDHDGTSRRLTVNGVKYRSGWLTDDLVIPYPDARVADPT